jgi:GrpB-like predicted nucleotidyltransferase (UPF0157 family)
MLGLAHDINYLVEPDPQWGEAFAEERARLARALGPVARGIEHFGSTSAPGLAAKPILDILVGVRLLGQWTACRPRLEALGYDYAADAGVSGHHIFGRGRDLSERTHLVHIVEHLGEEWRWNLAFRDALRADPALRAAYAREKAQAAATAPSGRARYNALKHDFIAEARRRLAV